MKKIAEEKEGVGEIVSKRRFLCWMEWHDWRVDESEKYQVCIYCNKKEYGGTGERF